MTEHELKAAIVSAGDELREQHAWRLDDDDDAPVAYTVFYRVLLKHLGPLTDTKAALDAKGEQA